MNAIVYTAITGHYDTLRNQPDTGDPFVAFVDKRIKRQKYPWKLQRIENHFANPVLTAKWYKMMPHLLFSDCEFSLWMDGPVKLLNSIPVLQLFNEYISDADIVLFKHYKRNCIYEEAWHCINKNLADREAIYRQINQYSADGYPYNNGLVEATVLLRRNNKRVRDFNEAWWEEIRNHTARDQISFNVVAQKTGIRLRYFNGTIHNNEYFKRHAHRHSFKRELELIVNASIWVTHKTGLKVKSVSPGLYYCIRNTIDRLLFHLSA